MCRLAALNQMKTPLKANCNVEPSQRCCGNNDSMEALQEFARTTTYNFVANESDMYEAMDTSLYRYVLLLRESQSRYLSHYRHVYRSTSSRTVTFGEESFSSWWKGQPDNFSFRKICGTRCMDVPKYKITKELFAYTMDRLDKFEDFLFLDNFDESLKKFSKHVGWSKRPRYAQNEDKTEKHMYPSLETDDWDPNMSALDDAIYEFALQKYNGTTQPSLSEQTQGDVEKYFEHGATSLCTHPCCTEAACSVY